MSNPITCARINESGVFQGMESLNESDLTPLHLPQITDCDLPVDAYRWVADADAPLGGAFVPLPKKTPDRQVREPNTLRAIYKALAAINAVTPLPTETREWLAWFSTTTDARE